MQETGVLGPERREVAKAGGHQTVLRGVSSIWGGLKKGWMWIFREGEEEEDGRRQGHGMRTPHWSEGNVSGMQVHATAVRGSPLDQSSEC